MLQRLVRFALPALCALACLTAIRTSARGADAEPTRMLRSPTVTANAIAFAYAQNIWIVDRAGGAARRLTSFQGQASNPHFSPDGKWIAFTGEYAGNFDVYVVAASGGEPRRLTWHPGPDDVQGWTPDGLSVVFTSSRATWAPGPTPRFWTVPATGGPEEPLPLPRAYQGRISPDGARIAYRMNNSWDEERRNYRGGQNRPIWITDVKTFETVTPPWDGSKDMDPAWLGETVYFISDRDGVANVWSFDTRSKTLTQETRFTDFDVKRLDTGAGAVVFEQAGVIHELDPKAHREHVVNIAAAGDFPWMMPRWEDVSNRVTNLAISPTGKRVLVEARGEVFTIPAEKGDTRNLTRSSGSAERDPAWSPDGNSICWFSDRSGEYQLVIEDQRGIRPQRTIAMPKPTHYYTVSWSPDSKKILCHDTNLRVWVINVATGAAKTVGSDPWMVPTRTMFPTWSPDSRYVAYAAHLNSLFRAIFVADAESGESHQVTDGLADAMYPVFDPSGKYLWFLASTDFGLRSQWLDMTSYDHTENFGLYLAVLEKRVPSPLLPESDEEGGAAPRGEPAIAEAAGDATERPAEKEKKDEKSVRPPVHVTIDFDGLQSRIVSVPGVPERPYVLLKAGAAGTVFYIETPPAAGGGGGGPAPRGTLTRYRLKERKPAAFASDVADFAVSADGKKLVYRTAAPVETPVPGAAPPRPPVPNLYLVDADKPLPAAGAPAAAAPAGAAAGTGKLAVSLSMWLDPRAEFAQIFAEGWRDERDYLYVPNMHGADWPKMREWYGQFLPSVRHRADLNYLLDMMGAEIAIGHSYVRGGDMPEVPTVRGGLLGADVAVDAGRYRITRIYDNESWNPDLKAPLASPGVNVAAGDYILAVNGEELRAPDNIYRLLDGTANKQTVLTVNGRPTLEGAREVTVVPIANEQTLRTRAWVESNRRLVDKLSGGQLAYVYLPNTGQPGYTSFNRYYFSQQDRKGVVIDERYNGGGSAADYMIDIMQRKFDGYFNNVAGERTPFTSPEAGIWGPKVMIANEMSGSGGDYLPYMFRSHHVGTLVGKRTWGGLVHTADTPLFVDGGSMIAPRGGFFAADGHWAVENEGVAPDVDVENWPKDAIAGRDAQLEKAIEVGLQQLKEHPVTRMTKEPAPPTWGARKAQP
ncbi:MAG: PD40 domain-containing protein [Candidatus Eisenbacteria bacterium]|nr:PD40 domain-containing protein [Candidatus Eisenbacteria bacterium]